MPDQGLTTLTEPAPTWSDQPAKACKWSQIPAEHDPAPFDDIAHMAMRRDLRVVVQDLASEGKRPGQIARMFGLTPVEVRRMLRAKP